MQAVQNQTFTIIQEIQKKVNEMYTDWKATGGFGSHTDNDPKWIGVRKHFLHFFIGY